MHDVHAGSERRTTDRQLELVGGRRDVVLEGDRNQYRIQGNCQGESRAPCCEWDLRARVLRAHTSHHFSASSNLSDAAAEERAHSRLGSACPRAAACRRRRLCRVAEHLQRGGRAQSHRVQQVFGDQGQCKSPNFSIASLMHLSANARLLVQPSMVAFHIFRDLLEFCPPVAAGLPGGHALPDPLGGVANHL